MHYLIISAMHTSPWGGSEELWYLNAIKKLKEGNTVSVLYPFWEEPSEKFSHLTKLGAQVIFFPNNTIPKKTPLNLFQKIQERINGLINHYEFNVNKLKPDLILVSQGGAFSAARNPILYQFLSNTNIPYILISQQNIATAFQSEELIKHARILHDRCVRWYFVSKQNLEFAELQLAKNLYKAKVVSNVPGFQSNGMLPFPRDQKITFSSVARLFVKDKGQDILLKALSSDQWKNRDWSLELYGSGTDEYYLKELTSYFSLENRVEFKGKVSNVAETWVNNKVLLMGSRNEGTPLSLIEAFSVGRTAVVTDIGGNAEWVQDNYNGFLAKYPHPDVFCDALERMWENKNQLSLFSERAFEKFKSKNFVDSFSLFD